MVPAEILKFSVGEMIANALFKNDETLKVAERICREAIERYYGSDALERFHEKEKKSKDKLNEVYDNPVWEDLNESIETLIDSMAEQETETQHDEKVPTPEEEVKVEIFRKTPDNRFYCGRCPRCGMLFDYDESFINRLVRCRSCGAVMRLRKAQGGASA
jgi:uncharacterized C2H2 Zn-finger protein